MHGVCNVHQLSRSQAGTGVRCWILKTRYIPQCEVVLLEKLRPTCLSWYQWSRTRLKITKALAVSDHMHLLWLSK